jgi:hypothetical protein
MSKTIIKEVPTKVFQKALNKWMCYSLGITHNDICSYCRYFEIECDICPLGINNLCDYEDLSRESLYWRWYNACALHGIDSELAMELADQMLFHIIDLCVYEVEDH